MVSKFLSKRIPIALLTVIIMVLQIQIVSVQAADSGSLQITHTYAPSNSVERDHPITFGEEVLLADFKVTEYEGKEYKLCGISIDSETKLEKKYFTISVVDESGKQLCQNVSISGDIESPYYIDLLAHIPAGYKKFSPEEDTVYAKFEEDKAITIWVTKSQSKMSPQVEQNSLEIQNCGYLGNIDIGEDEVDTQMYRFSENENYTIDFFYEEIPETYKISYDGNEGTGSVVDEYEYTQGAASKTKVNEFSRDNYKFINWNTKSDGTGLAYDENAEIVVEKNVTLYAQWQENKEEKYTVTYSGNGGAGSVVDENEYTQSTVANTKENEFARNGYKFINWNTEIGGTGHTYGENAEIVVEENVTLYAQWQKNEDEEKYAISYSGNGGTGSVNDEKQYSTGETATVKENAFTKDGYKFVDWNTVSDGSGTSFSEGSSFYVENNVTLYAQWQETVVKNIFKVTYDSNGGIGAVVDDKEYEKGSEAEVKENTFTKSNNKFLNWNTVSDGSGIVYNSGDIITIEGDTTLFAQWKENDYDPGTWTEPETPDIPNVVVHDENEPYTELDDNGVPLGTWHKAPDTGEWIFIPIEVPLGDSPETGDTSNAIAFAGVIIIALGAVVVLRKNKKI